MSEHNDFDSRIFYELGEVVKVEKTEQTTVEQSDVDFEKFALEEERKVPKHDFKGILSCSIVGMLLSVFMGFGFLFSLYGTMKSMRLLRWKKSQTLVWTRNVGAIGLIMNAFCFVVIIAYLSFFM